MDRLNRQKSISCNDITISINVLNVSPKDNVKLYLNQDDNYLAVPTPFRITVPNDSGVDNRENSVSQPGCSKFLEIPNQSLPKKQSWSKFSASTSALPETISASAEIVNMVDRTVIGRDAVYDGPFGLRRLIYLDHTASGKSIKCIEDFIQKNVLPYYANTHTVSSFTSVQTTKYREEAREYVRKATGAGSDDVVIFHGSGTTSCVHKLIHHVMCSDINSSMRTIVFVGPFEHHSNILPWREAGAKIVNVPVNKYGQVDMKFLESKLKETRKFFKSRAFANLVGCFSATSNVTGIVSDDVALTILLHKYNGLAFFDYAAAAPHVKISMNPKLKNSQLAKMAEKDAIYFSGHKFMGGPQTTGVLIAKKQVFKNAVPHGQGGGTVDLVTSHVHHYVNDIVEREEGGTPSIVENIRLGLVMKLKMSIGEETIVAREANFVKRAFRAWENIPNLVILGDTNNPRVPIVSFMIEHPESGYYLHHNFVASVLNDLFGIQTRGGCMCAGPYAQILLRVNDQLALDYETIFAKSRVPCADNRDGLMIFKPGFTRLSFPYHASFDEVDYTIEAVAVIATHGWKLLPFYTCNVKSASFTFTGASTISPAKSLSNCNFDGHGLTFETSDSKHVTPPSLQECLNVAADIIRRTKPLDLSDGPSAIPPEAEKLRWFLMPYEANAFLHTPANPHIKSPQIFDVRKTNFKPKSIKRIQSETLQGSVMDQILNTVWTNERHLLTDQIVAEDLHVRQECRFGGSHRSSDCSGYISSSSYVDSDYVDDL